MASETSYAAVGVGVILSVFVLAAASADPTAAPTAAPSSSKHSLEEVCKQTTGHQDLCVATLSADPSSKTADTAGLAQLAIQAAQRNASETVTYLSSIYDDDSLENKTAQLQQCLEDCGERYESAVEQLSDATSAVDTGAYSESEALVVANQAEVKLCQRGCQGVPDHRNVLTARNRDVDQLCSIALTITKLIRGPPS
ncbi:cell wall / vacuolar inhibitor of fructosidase 2-like [Miscanthus floridulus]|uniref:cell wall / vacuolar inhibitor of fructosidase 2-like n=1 Tax=Miscanthus floridulus TaxID=154761 RepID=UPI003458F139